MQNINAKPALSADKASSLLAYRKSECTVHNLLQLAAR